MMSIIVIYAVAWVIFEDLDLDDLYSLRFGIAIFLSMVSLLIWMILSPL